MLLARQETWVKSSIFPGAYFRSPIPHLLQVAPHCLTSGCQKISTQQPDILFSQTAFLCCPWFAYLRVLEEKLRAKALSAGIIICGLRETDFHLGPGAQG